MIRDMTKEQTLAALKNQIDSFYSLQQVINIIEGIEEPETQTVSVPDQALVEKS